MYAQDFDMDTASWSNNEIGMYMRLLNYEWVNGSIPSDLEQIARIAREPYSPRFHAKFTVKWSRNVAGKFTQNGNGNLINKRMEDVRQNQSKYSESRRKNVSIRYKDKPTYVDTYESTQALHTPRSSSSSSSSKKESIKKERKLPDAEWLKELQNKPCYSHLSIQTEFEKCETWFQEREMVVSRKRFLSWINRSQFQTKPIQKEDPYKNYEYVKGGVK